MLTLNDGRAELWQWDTGRTLAVDADCSQVHFSNKVFGRSIDVDVNDGVAIIPDILLQTDKELNVWAFVGTAENGYTKISKTFKVNRRNKPADYVFTPPEKTTLAELVGRLDKIEESQDPDAIKNAVEDYLDKNPVEAPVQSVNGKTGTVELTAEDVGAISNETDPTVPAWAKQPTKPTYTAAEVGAISQDDLQEATNEALAQAKASGEFDGAPGADGHTPEYGVDYGTPEQISGIAQKAAGSLQPDVDQIKDDLANKVPKSDYAPEAKTDAMTQPVGKDADGKLWTAPGSGGSGITVSGATVGQTVRIADVDDDGVPTAWEPVDLPSGGGDLQWYKVAETKITEEITEYVVSQDFDGNPIKSYNPVAIALYFAVPADSTQASANGSPWIYPSASTYIGETGIRVIANIANWKTIARTNTQVFFGSEHGIVGIGAATTGSLSALNLGHVIMDGVKIHLYNNGDHFPVGTHFIVSVLVVRA